jgi:hypothetical protein
MLSFDVVLLLFKKNAKKEQNPYLKRTTLFSFIKDKHKMMQPKNTLNRLKILPHLIDSKYDLTSYQCYS